MDRNIIAGLDIGTTKVVVVVAEVKANQLEIIGIGSNTSRGLKRGMVINIEDTVESIQSALKEAELMANCKVERVYTSIAGGHIKCHNSSGMVAIRDKEVKASDIERVIETAKAIHIPAGHQLLYISARDYKVDDQEGVREPLGMSGVRLEARVHLVTGASSAIENLLKCVRRCGLTVTQLLLQPIASSDAVLKDDEKESGVLMIDIGGGTTDISIFMDGTIRHTASIPVAGDQITNDIAMALRVPTREAEFIKEQHGVAKQLMADAQKMIDVESTEERSARIISQQALAAVIEPRVEEILQMVRDNVRELGVEPLIPYVVVTGGGALLKGMNEMVEDVLQKQCRIGKPTHYGSISYDMNSPRFATVSGLLLAAFHDVVEHDVSHDSAPLQTQPDWWQKISDWFKTNF